MSHRLDARSPGFRNIKSLIRRMDLDPRRERDQMVSVSDRDVPAWQRQTVWTDEEMGLLACSILKNYPIGMVILWKKPDGVRVPIDGRQRLTAIHRFFCGAIALPDLPSVPDEWRKMKYCLLDEDEEGEFDTLSADLKDAFDDYQLEIVEYEGIDESTAMEIFVMLQGGKSLTKTEVRAALGGQVCDFVSALTSNVTSTADSDENGDEEPAPSRHQFFQDLSANLANRRKSHRNVADILLHEKLYPGQDKHWTSLEKMYREKASALTAAEQASFRTALGRFHRSVKTQASGQNVLIPQLRSAFFILSVFRAWQDLFDNYDMPTDFAFGKSIAQFELERVRKADDIPWVNFTAALSNAGYAQNRIQERHDILMSFLLRRCPDAKLKSRDQRRIFTMEQKIAIWERAGHRCEWKDVRGGVRCPKTFEHPRKAEADHVVMWKDNGPTSIENGRLLCTKHNRARRD